MKIVAIGDIHGLDTWKEIVKLHPDADKYVFIGDYFDSFDIYPVVQIQNFKEILEFKNDNMDKVELLIGNHDFHYTNLTLQKYSGFNNVMSFDYGNLVNENISNRNLKMIFKYNDFIFSHAGISKTWAMNYNLNINDIESEVNLLFKYNPSAFEFVHGVCDGTGSSVEHSPIWIRPNALIKDKIDGIHIFGHTHMNEVSYIENEYYNIDCLPNQYLVIENDICIIKNI